MWRNTWHKPAILPLSKYTYLKNYTGRYNRDISRTPFRIIVYASIWRTIALTDENRNRYQLLRFIFHMPDWALSLHHAYVEKPGADIDLVFELFDSIFIIIDCLVSYCFHHYYLAVFCSAILFWCSHLCVYCGEFWFVFTMWQASFEFMVSYRMKYVM